MGYVLRRHDGISTVKDIRIAKQDKNEPDETADPQREVAKSGKQSKLHPLTGYEYWACDSPEEASYADEVKRKIRLYKRKGVKIR